MVKLEAFGHVTNTKRLIHSTNHKHSTTHVYNNDNNMLPPHHKSLHTSSLHERYAHRAMHKIKEKLVLCIKVILMEHCGGRAKGGRVI